MSTTGRVHIGELISYNPDNILDTLRVLKGYWKYNGGKYLAELTSGKVSDTYANCSVLTSRPVLTEAVGLSYYARDLAEMLLSKMDGRMDWTQGSELVDRQNALKKPLYICGPAFGGITLSYEMARQLGGVAIFTEKSHYLMENPSIGKAAIVDTKMELKRFAIPEGATILFVEDVITTGKSTREMIEAVAGSLPRSHTSPDNPNPIEYITSVLCLVNRSGSTKLDMPNGPHKGEWGIISCAEIQARTWDTLNDAREEGYIVTCPECKGVGGDCLHCCNGSVGVEAIRPKGNWDKLTGEEQ